MRLSFKREADSGAEQISLERCFRSASSSCPDSAVVVVFPDVALSCSAANVGGSPQSTPEGIRTLIKELMCCNYRSLSLMFFHSLSFSPCSVQSLK